MITSLTTRWYTYSDLMKPYEADIDRKMLFQLSSASTAQTIGELFAQYWVELWPDTPTYPQDFIYVSVRNLTPS